MGDKLVKFIFSNDSDKMNWFRPDYEYAEVISRNEISSTVTTVRKDDCLYTSVELMNTSGNLLQLSETDVSIRLPLEDRYDSTQICMKSRCHVHIFCGNDISYVCAIKMNGNAPHLGIVFTEGKLSGYSIERDPKNSSNDRGCFLLHPAPFELMPFETMRICWTVFPHSGWDNFFAGAGEIRPFVRVDASKYVLFPGEESKILVRTSFQAEHVSICNRNLTPESDQKDTVAFTYRAPEDAFTSSSDLHGLDNGRIYCREVVIPVEADGIHTFVRLILQESPENLVKKRCEFIVQNQQYFGKDEHLHGAYLAYDNEEEHVVYDKINDLNAGRERAGMGLLMCRYCGAHPEQEKARVSLDAYMQFVGRELVYSETGLVANDYRYDDSYKRAYNYPWYAGLYTEYYRLSGDTKHLLVACRIIRKFYQEGGKEHYSIELPVSLLCSALKKEGMEEELSEMTELFEAHADRIAELDLNYPPFEVNFEQSIVAPAAWILLQVFEITGKDRYLKAARKQLHILEQFNGHQPDAHLNETAIRHWDGFWFGKYKQFGDTFPHYWSGLTGNCFLLYSRLTGNEAYKHRAETSLRGVLPLIFPDGRASCACLFPEMVNGVRTIRYDPYANDQDWGLYFWLRNKCR